MSNYKRTLKQRINKLLNDYYKNELNKITRLCDQKNIEYHIAFEEIERVITPYIRIYQVLTINDSQVGYLYKVYSDRKNRRFKLIYYDDYEKVLFADNADTLLSILEILFINQSNKMEQKR